MNADNVRAELNRLAAREGLRSLARRLGLDPGYLSRVCNGYREPGPAITNALGYEKVEVYRKTSSKRLRA